MRITDNWLKASWRKYRPKMLERADRDGLTVRVSTTGTISFVVRLRCYGMRNAKRLVIGSDPRMSLQNARAEAAPLRGRLEQGHDTGPCASSRSTRSPRHRVTRPCSASGTKTRSQHPMPLPKHRSKSAARRALRPRSAQLPPHPLARLWRTFLTGLVAVIPVGVTLYVVYWLFSAADSLFSGIGQRLLPQGWYFPGLGLVVAVLVVLGMGAILNVSVFGRLTLKVGSRLLERIPLVKTVYSGVRDLMLFVSRTPDGDSRHVVVVTLPGDIRLIGFITDSEPVQAVPELGAGDGEKVLTVYLPMSYQIGGYALFLPERCLQRIEMSVEEAMRMVLTAGMNRPPAEISQVQQPVA